MDFVVSCLKLMDRGVLSLVTKESYKNCGIVSIIRNVAGKHGSVLLFSEIVNVNCILRIVLKVDGSWHGYR